MTDPKKVDGPEGPPVAVGAIGLTSRKIFPKTLAPQPVPFADQSLSDEDAAQTKPAPPAAGQEAAPPPERTINLSDVDTDVRVESNPPPTHSGHVLDAHAAPAKEATHPGGSRRRRPPTRSIVFAVAGGIGALALVLAARAFVHRTSEIAPSPSPAVSTSAVSAPSTSPSSPPVAVAPTADSVAADSVAAPPSSPPPAASAAAKHPAPRRRKHPVGPKSGPPKPPQ